MPPLLIKNARLVSPTATLNPGWLLCDDKRIKLVGTGPAPAFEQVETVDASGLLLMPGFIDVHVHGGSGYEAMDATSEALRCMAQFYATHGVTSFLATTWTDSPQRIKAAMEAIAAVQGPQPSGATILGAHMEGPYLNPKQCGAQNVN